MSVTLHKILNYLFPFWCKYGFRVKLQPVNRIFFMFHCHSFLVVSSCRNSQNVWQRLLFLVCRKFSVIKPTKKSLIQTTCIYLYQGRYLLTAVPPWFTEISRALCEILTYLRQLTYALRRRVLGRNICFWLRPLWSIWLTAFHPALTFPDSLWVHDNFDLHFNGLSG